MPDTNSIFLSFPPKVALTCTKSKLTMATDCCSILSITEVLCIHLLGNEEMRLYRTCMTIYDSHQVRREWWQHVQHTNCLMYHLNPVKAKRAWDSFFAWRDYVYGGSLPEYFHGLRPSSGSDDDNPATAHNASLEDHYGPDEWESMSHSSYSSCPDHPPEDATSEFSDGASEVHEWLTGVGPNGGPPCEQCWELPSVYRNDIKGLMCHRCIQNDTLDQLVGFWGHLLRNHRVFGNAEIARNIAEHVCGTGLEDYCYCGECDPNWFLRGWICWTPN